MDSLVYELELPHILGETFTKNLFKPHFFIYKLWVIILSGSYRIVVMMKWNKVLLDNSWAELLFLVIIQIDSNIIPTR